ncbi:hypothetical protein PISMIDRAFT_30334 [Pisolithus microcarpus 441]|uniref:Unplaced genomic scaffold scaffold_102, whole genome shotgun sequence n=1 Tax=Pisolithus microcarpus 441 TaxID=765257 RepID=A0A0C9ZH89_9AGAM|nr:hypothetical protein PISMIDRAFT_30334 [Pisolithus microcarpus 441]
MLSAIFSLAVFSTIAQINGYVVPRATPPAGWDTSALEPYDTYHCRYLAIGCQYQHGTSFFDSCCHPLQANQSVSSLPSECQQPSNTTCSNGEPVTAPAPTSTPTAQPAGETTPASTPTPVTPTPTSTPAATTPTPSPTPAPANVGGNPTTTTSSAPAAQSSPASSGSTGSSLNSGGFATFFYQNGNAGACGQVNPDTAFICAMDSALYSSSLCGKQVQITNTDNGQSVTVTVADECPTCANANSIDLSVAAFEAIADLSTGQVPITWQYV